MIESKIDIANITFTHPSDWSVIKIKNLLLTKVTDGPHETPTFIDEGYPFLSVDSIVDGKLVFEGCRFISKEDYDKYKIKCNPQKDDIFMGKAASIGKIAIVDVDFNFSIWSPLALLRPNKDLILPKFLEFALKSDYAQDQIELYSTSNTQKNISMDDIPRIKLLVPNLEQQKIVINYLNKKTSKIDETIAKNQKLIELLEEKRVTLINQVVTKGLNPDVAMKDSGVEWMGEIPEQYSIVKLKFLTSKIGSGKTPKGGSEIYVSKGIPLLRSQNIHFDSIRLDDVVYITEEINQNMLSTVVKNNDVLLNITGASIGRCNYIEDIGTANVNQHVCIIRPNEKIFYKYLNYFLQSECGQNQVFLNQNGTSREGLNFEDLSNFYIILPKDIKEQKSLVSYLEKEINKIFDTIDKVKENINLLEEYKTSLIHHVVTGKIDVRGEEI